MNAEVERLKAWIRTKQTGGCRMLSQGDDCHCPLCNVDHLAADLRTAQQKIDQLRSALLTIGIFFCIQRDMHGKPHGDSDDFCSSCYAMEKVKELDKSF